MMLMNAEARVSRRYINHSELHPFDTVPAVEAQRAGGVHGSPTALPEPDPELLSGGAKRNGVDDRAVPGTQPRTHMGLPYLFGIDEGMGRQRDDRFWIARAERTRARDRRHDAVVGGSGGERPVDQQRILAPRSFDRACERIFEIGAERAQRILAQRDAGCHGVAAAFDDETRAHGVAYGAAEVDAGDRTPGPGADAARLERDGEGGPSEPLLQSRGDEADHAWMPAIGSGHDDGPLLLDTERSHGLGLGLRQGGEFDRLALAVESIEFGGKPRAFARVVL